MPPALKWLAAGRQFIVGSLRAKLLVFAALLVLVPGIVFAVMTVVSARRALETAVGRQLAEVAHNMSAEVVELLEREQHNVVSWAHQDLILETADGDRERRVSRFLTALRQGDASYLRLLCIDVRGRVVAASDPSLLGTAHGSAPWAQAALAGQQFFSGPADVDGLGRVLQIATPIRDPAQGDAVVGAMLALYDWDRVAALTRRIQRNSRKVKLFVDVVLLGSGGEALAEALPLYGSSLSGHNLRAEGWRTARPRSRFTRPGFLHEPIPDALVGFAPVDAASPQWRVLVIQPVGVALAEVYRLQRRLVVILLAVLLSALGVSLLFAERLSRPLRELTRATTEFARVGEVRQLVPVRSRDEIGQLSEAFNAMATRLTRALDDLVIAAKFAFVGEVAAGVAHEVRTPLGILRSSAQLLARSQPTDRPQNAELVEMMVGEVDRIDRVVAGLLELARPREPAAEPTPLEPLLGRALDFVDTQARQDGITIQRAFAAHTPQILGDPEQIYQVALNLILNALQVLPRGGALCVSTFGRDGCVGFAVTDNGPGIPPEVREQIFTPFFTLRKGGTGLGLAVVQRIVQAHQGTVSVESKVGCGTTFRVELPAAEGA